MKSTKATTHFHRVVRLNVPYPQAGCGRVLLKSPAPIFKANGMQDRSLGRPILPMGRYALNPVKDQTSFKEVSGHWCRHLDDLGRADSPLKPLDWAYLKLPKPTFCRVPINSVLGFTIVTYKKVGSGSLR